MLESRGRILDIQDPLVEGVQHAVIYRTGHPDWVVRESRRPYEENTPYSGEEAAWERVHEARGNPRKFRLTEREHQALTDNVLVPAGTRFIEKNGKAYLQSFYPRKTTDLERYFRDGGRNQIDGLEVVGNMLEQIAPAVDALIKTRIYHADMVPINTLIDEESGELSIIDFGRCAVYTGVTMSGEDDCYKEMITEFFSSLVSIASRSGLAGSSSKLQDEILSVQDRHKKSMFFVGHTLCQNYAQQLKPALVSASAKKITL